MSTIIQYFTYTHAQGFNFSANCGALVDVRNFYRYTEYYKDYLTIQSQIINKVIGPYDARTISYIQFDDSELDVVQAFIGECSAFSLTILINSEALALARDFSPARAICDETYRVKQISEYNFNLDGVLEQTIS